MTSLRFVSGYKVAVGKINSFNNKDQKGNFTTKFNIKMLCERVKKL